MIIGGLVEIFLGVAAEGKSLEDVASPLSMVKKAAATVGDATKSPRRCAARPANCPRPAGPAAAFLVVAGPRPSPGLDC